MAGLISERSDSLASDKPGTTSLFINGICYTNSAAKFWPSLIDEVRNDFPDCSLIELNAPFAGNLIREHLYPEMALEKNLHRLLSVDFQDALRDALAELEILGPPSSVQVRLLSGHKEVLSRGLPLACVDADILPYLAVWLLEWGGVPVSSWNREFLDGDILAEDRKSRFLYRFSFTLTNHHLSEGLYQRALSIIPSCDKLPHPHLLSVK